MTWFESFCRDSGSSSSRINLALQNQPLRVSFKRFLRSVENMPKDNNVFRINYGPMEGLMPEYTVMGKCSLSSS